MLVFLDKGMISFIHGAQKMKWYSLWLCGIFFIAFILQLVLPVFTDLFVLNQLSFVQPWRFVSAIFLHGDLAHILYNTFALALFGSMLERLIGSRRFMIIFFVTGILANGVSVFFYPSSLGASGAIFGIIGALIIIRPTLVVWAFGLPMPIFIAGILWGIGDLVGALSYLSGNPADSTGNIAHLSGMLFGLVFGASYRNWAQRREKRMLHRLDEGSMRRWEDQFMR